MAHDSCAKKICVSCNKLSTVALGQNFKRKILTRESLKILLRGSKREGGFELARSKNTAGTLFKLADRYVLGSQSTLPVDRLGSSWRNA